MNENKFSILNFFFLCSRHFFAILCQNESIELLMKYYNDLVPHIYVPEPTISEVIKYILQ